MGIEHSPFSYHVVIGVSLLITLALKLLKAAGWNWSSLTFRTLGLFCLWALLVGVYFEQPGKKTAIPVLLDVSDSMSSLQAQDLLDRARGLLGTRELKILPFAKKSAPVTDDDSVGSYDSIHDRWGQLDAGGSNIEESLSTASTLTSSGPAILITDGNENTGRAEDAVGSLNSAKLSLYPIVPIEDTPPQFVGISQMQAPLVATQEKQSDIRISLANFSSDLIDGSLYVTQSGKRIYSSSAPLTAGQEQVVTVQSEKAAPGLNEITATYRWKDSKGLQKESSHTIFLSGENKEKILLLNGSQDDDRFLSKALQNEAYQVDVWTSGQPSPPLPITNYSVIILNNIPNNLLPFGAGLIRDYVEKGGGLLMLGGAKSFGLGGYIGSPIEEVLPVKLVPPQTTKKRLNVAVQLVLDKSKSMAKASKLEFAQDAANEVVRNLKNEDLVGIIAFDTSPFEVLPMMELSRARAIAADRINRLFANEATNMYPALEEGWRALLKVNAGRKHMIILTDGKVYDAGPIYLQLVRQIRLSGVTVSTVLLGEQGEEDMLREMADLGGGSYYQTADPQNLPRIFVSDVKVSTGEETLKETSISVRRGTGTLRATSITTYPGLKGYVETLPRDDSNLELIVTTGERASPLMATRRVENGKVLAYTSDANGRWSSQWVGWQEFSHFWSDLINSVRPAAKANATPKFDLRRYVERGELVLDATIYTDPPPSSVTITLTTPTGRTESLSLVRTATGRFIGKLTTPEAGRYKAKLIADGMTLPEVGWSISGELFGERRDLPINRQLLERLASLTGGKVNPTKDELSMSAKTQPTKYKPTVPLILFFLLFFVLEVCAREMRGVLTLFRTRRYSRE